MRGSSICGDDGFLNGGVPSSKLMRRPGELTARLYVVSFRPGDVTSLYPARFSVTAGKIAPSKYQSRWVSLN
ncbi:hypothetical protein KCP78_15095 [Salmonella enterica subsp. enterica]|nr:hypothetical protein KCP78_15095 [Salmonella enterica subsp. enterica]